MKFRVQIHNVMREKPLNIGEEAYSMLALAGACGLRFPKRYGWVLMKFSELQYTAVC